MLKELHISNYLLFDELTIHDLKQVNLIAGKNNTGKTALLEALRIWAELWGKHLPNPKGYPTQEILKEKGFFKSSNGYNNIPSGRGTKSLIVWSDYFEMRLGATKDCSGLSMTEA